MKTLKSIKVILWKATLVLFLGLLLFVFYHSLSAWNSTPFLMEALGQKSRMFITVLSICLFFFLFLLIKKMIWKKEAGQLKKVAYVMFGIYIILQLLYLIFMQVGLRYDALKTFDEAVSVCKNGVVSDANLDGYFARYTNNYPILFVTIALLKLFRFLNIAGAEYENGVFLLGLVNIFMIDMGIFFSWKLIGKMKGENTAFLSLIFLLCNPVFLIWTPFYYTNTVSMGLMMIVLYGIYCLFVEKRTASCGLFSYFKAVVLGFLLWLGCSIRATVFITVIAIGAYFFLRPWKEKRDIKEDAKKVFFVLGGILLAVGILVFAEKKYVPFDTTDTAFPAIHWIAMGAGGQGVYNIVDEHYTMSFETKEEKTAADLELFRERIGQLGIKGYVKLMFDKLKLTWADGSGGYLSELGVSQCYLPVHKYFLGSKADLLGVYGAVFYSFCLAMTGMSVLYSIVRKKEMDFLYIIKLNLLGGFLFHMLWEAGSIYSIGFMTLLSPAMTEGFEWMEDAISRKAGKKSVYFWSVPAAILCLFLIWKKDALFETDYVENEATVNQFLYQCDEEKWLSDEELYVQTFQGDKNFNRLGIQVKNQLGERNGSCYRILLLDGEKELVAEQKIEAGKIVGYQFVTLSFDTIDGRKNDDFYYVVIEKVKGSSEEGLTFLSYNTGNYDAYRNGSLLIYKNMEVEQFRTEENAKKAVSEQNQFQDLAFCVYEQRIR